MEKFCKIKHSVYYLLTIFIQFNCAGSPPATIPEPVPEVVISTVVVPPKPPESITIHSIEYDRNSMIIEWGASKDYDFKKYILLTTQNEPKIVDTLSIIKDISDTVFVLEQFDPTIIKWFWIVIENKSGLRTEGERSTYVLETIPPNKTTILPIEFDDQLKIRWIRNHDHDFCSYEIYQSLDPEMNNRIKLKTLESHKDTLFVLPMDNIYFYQIGIKDYWGLESYSNIIKGDYIVKIWNEEYSILSTKEIDLSSMKLFGEIPSELGLLSNLEILRLQNNFLSGPMPESFSNLKKLRLLNLSNNHLTGSISNKINEIVSLEELWLSRNQFSGDLPYQIYLLSNLTHLNISENYIKGNLNESISRLSKLEYLNLWDNELSGFIPPDIGSLSKLEFLSLGGNKLVGEIPKELGNAKRLQSIALFENDLSGMIPVSLTELTELKYLGLFDNNFQGNISNNLFNTLDLSYLRLDKNRFNAINQDSMCTSGYDWRNFIFYDVSDNFFENTSICLQKDDILKIQSSVLEK
tara:strand:- start:139 stop:1707 length:1569 start_codon:yes stop_codon:yes gene_type:complete